MASTRRLAAVLAADVAGYSRLMGADEEGTLTALKAIRRELGDPKIAEHHGRIVKTTGDGLLVEFPSVVDAVRCAVEVQKGMAERNADVPPDKRIEFRVGINLGDIISDDGDIFGEGVNITARLEGLAEPGGICVSGTVREHIGDRLPYVFDDMGDQHVKNIVRPVRVFRIPIEETARRIRVLGFPNPAPLPLPDKPSIAVLPFQNMSGDPEQEYFADGMVEEITTAISRLPWLFVIARNSAFTYKGKAIDVRQVAHELGVRYVLEGSVRKAGSRVRITGQLVDTATSAHIWADRFDSSLDDIFELQDRVASTVVGAIEPRLRQSEIERASRKPTESLGAYDLYMRALEQTYRYTEASVAAAIALFRQALTIDPFYAPAAAMIGWCRWAQLVQGWEISDDDIADCIRLARLALREARDDADTMWQAGYTLFLLCGETAIAAAYIDRALTLNPNAANGWMIRGWFCALTNQPEQAIEACDRARRLSPFDPLGFLCAAASAAAHLAAGHFDQSIEWADRALHDQPCWVVAMRIKIVACAHFGRLDEARAELTRLLGLYPEMTITRWRTRLPATSFAPEYLALNVAGLRKAGMPEE
jgi:TolB-like protein/class 3 adenylate cyclase